jgi:hypothetical protein
MLEFYLFDVSHGQCAAARLPNGRWCVFDAGGNDSFSPIVWIVERATGADQSTLEGLLSSSAFRFLKATISHLHGDHVYHWKSLLARGPEYLRTVAFDRDHLLDVAASSTDESWASILEFCKREGEGFSPATTVPNYGGASIAELDLGVGTARSLGGSANSRVNNSSIVTRLDCYGNSILLCGDLETEGWEYALRRSAFSEAWRRLVSNVDILVAPHHGHTAGFSTDLMALAKPKVVLVSVRSGDDCVDTRYSDSTFVSGITIDGVTRRCMTTRQMEHIKVSINAPESPSTLAPLALQLLPRKGSRSWTFGDRAIGWTILDHLLRGTS